MLHKQMVTHDGNLWLEKSMHKMEAGCIGYAALRTTSRSLWVPAGDDSLRGRFYLIANGSRMRSLLGS